MSEVWMRFIDILGYEQAEKLRFELAGEVIRIPKSLPKCIIVPLVKKDLKDLDYQAVVKKYGLSECTVRRYEKWKIKDGNTNDLKMLISPSGRVYELELEDLYQNAII